MPRATALMCMPRQAALFAPSEHLPETSQPHPSPKGPPSYPLLICSVLVFWQLTLNTILSLLFQSLFYIHKFHFFQRPRGEFHICGSTSKGVLAASFLWLLSKFKTSCHPEKIVLLCSRLSKIHTAFGIALHDLLKKKTNNNKTELFLITTDVI